MDQSIFFDLNGDDDDVGWGKNFGGAENGGEGDDSKWLQEIFNSLEKKCDEANGGGLVSSDVKDSSKDCVNECEEEEEDDCVILDGDPDKAGVESENVAVGDDSDELVVVKETGQVACRDYPHPRDLCAKFPFTTTPHEQYCNQCHCYVCDAPAPCLKWGTGSSVSDHCHATGKMEIWNQQRESLKSSHQSTVTVPRVQCTSMPTQLIQTNQASSSTPQIQYNIPPAQVPMSAPTPSIQYQTPQTQVPWPAPNTYRQHQAFQAQTPRPALIWPSAAAVMNMQSNRGQGYVIPRNNLQLNLASQQLRNTGNNALAWGRRHNVGSSAPRINVPPAAVFKRRGTSGVISVPNQRAGHLINGHGSTIHARVPTAVLAPGNYNTMISAQKNGNSNMCRPSLQPYMRPMPSNMLAFQSQLQPHLFSQSSVATTSLNQVPTQPLFAQSNTGNVFVYSTTQPQIPSQKAYVGGMFSRPVAPQPQVSFQPKIANNFGNTVPSGPPVSSQPSHASNSLQNVNQQQNQTNNFGDTSFTDIGLNGLTNTTNPSSQQAQAQNAQLPASDLFDDSLPFGEFDCFFGGSSNTGSFDSNPWILNSEESARLSSESASATVDVGTLFG